MQTTFFACKKQCICFPEIRRYPLLKHVSENNKTKANALSWRYKRITPHKCLTTPEVLINVLVLARIQHISNCYLASTFYSFYGKLLKNKLF